MSELVQIRRDGDVAIVTINNPPVNALAPAVLQGLLAAVEELKKDDAVRAVVLTGAGRAFSGGADINEFQKITSGQKQSDGAFHAFLTAAGRLQVADRALADVCAWIRLQCAPTPTPAPAGLSEIKED